MVYQWTYSKNTISQFLKGACQKAGVPGRKTNHSARKTCVKRALDAGCPREYVAQLTGHKSVNSLENYADADDSVQQAMCSSVMHGVPFNISVNRAGTATSVNTTVSSAASTSAPATVTQGATTIVFNVSNCANVNINTK